MSERDEARKAKKEAKEKAQRRREIQAIGWPLGALLVWASDALDAWDERQQVKDRLRDRDIELSGFQAYQQCPKCEGWAFHPMKPGGMATSPGHARNAATSGGRSDRRRRGADRRRVQRSVLRR